MQPIDSGGTGQSGTHRRAGLQSAQSANEAFPKEKASAKNTISFT
jgi:hypothetical protein